MGLLTLLGYFILFIAVAFYLIMGLFYLIDNKFITTKRFFVFIALSSLVSGFVYNYINIGTSLMKGLEGGVIALIVACIVFVAFRLTNKQKTT